MECECCYGTVNALELAAMLLMTVVPLALFMIGGIMAGCALMDEVYWGGITTVCLGGLCIVVGVVLYIVHKYRKK